MHFKCVVYTALYLSLSLWQMYVEFKSDSSGGYAGFVGQFQEMDKDGK